MNPFGPLFVFEIARVTRRQRLHVGRCAYVGVLLVLLGIIYLSLFPDGPADLFDYLFGSTADPKQLATFGYIFFVTFALVQFAVGAFAVTSASSAILAEEKERQTLPFLLTTPLSDREIVLGKLAARVAQVVMVLLAALPVLSIMQVMGGVDPLLLGAATVATGVTVLSGAGVGAAVSISANSVRQANGRALGWLLAYLLGGPYAGGLLQGAYGNVTLIPAALRHVTVGDVVDWLNGGNYFWVCYHLGRQLATSVPLESVLWPRLTYYVAFHGILAAVTVGWASWRLRWSLRRQADRGAAKASRLTAPLVRADRRSAVSETRPVYWRETATAVNRPGQKWYGRWLKRLAYVLSFAPVLMIVLQTGGPAGGTIGPIIHMVVRIYGTLVLTLSLAHVAVTASGSIGREKRQKTFDELCLTRLRNREILGQKVLAALWSARWYWVWVGVHWIIDLAAGGMALTALALVLPLFSLYAVAAAWLGMLFATFLPTRVRPQAAVALTLLCLAFLPWTLPVGIEVYTDGRTQWGERLAFVAAGLSPPVALGFLAIGPGEVERFFEGNSDHLYFPVGLAAGIGLYLAIIIVARRVALTRFAKERRE